MTRHRPAKTVALPAVSMLLVLAACQPAILPAAGPGETKFPHAERPLTALGTVTVRIDRQHAGGADFKTTAAADLAQIRRVRLTAKGPGMSPVSLTADWPLGAGQALNLRVPIGKNRLLVFEGLDADGYPLVTLRAPVASVTATAQEISLDANTDVAGRTLERLIAEEPGRNSLTPLLNNDTLVAQLHACVQRITGYDAEANTFRYVTPRNVRTAVIVQRLLDFGIYTLGSSLPASLFLQANANVNVTVTNAQGNPIAGATVQVLDPTSTPATTDADGKATVQHVPAGTWTVKATSGTLVARNTVTTLDQETTGTVLLSLRPPRVETPTVTSQALIDEVRLLITGTDDPQASATQLTSMVERLVEESATEAEALTRLNEAFAAAISSEADVTALAAKETALDGWTVDSSLAAVDRMQTQSFRTAQTVPGCGPVRPKLTLLYINDSMSTYLDFLRTYQVLFKRLRGSLVVPDLKVLGVFNAPDTDAPTRTQQLKDLDGAGLFPWLRSTVWGAGGGRFTPNGGPHGLALVESLMQERPGLHFTRQIDRLTGLIETEVMSGNQVVLMPHGQGNHLAKRALEQVKAKAGRSEYGPRSVDFKTAIGTLALGSPVDPTVSDFSTEQAQVNVDRDFVTVLPTANARNSMVACSTPAQAVLANCAADAGGRPTVPSPIVSDQALAHHDCQSSYLAGEPWVAIKSHVERFKGNLRNPFSVAGSGALQFQLRWQSVGDVDMYIKEPSGNVVYFNRKAGQVGDLDVDNIFAYGPENFYVCDPARLNPGDEFQFGVNFYRNRGVDPIPYSMWIKAGNTSKTYTNTVTGANFGLSIIGLGRVRVGRDTRTGGLTYEILDGGATIPYQVALPPGVVLP